MAKDEKKVERVYNVPLRKEWLKKPKFKRAKRAAWTLRAFLAHHMKSNKVLIGKMANLKIWEQGMEHPPHHIQVKAVKDSDGVVRAELVGFEYKEDKKAAKKEKKGKVEELKERLMGKEKKAEVKESKPSAPPKEEKKDGHKTVSK